MVLDDFALLAADTARTKAYLQLMLKNDLKPSLCVVYTEDFEAMVRLEKAYEGSHDFGKYFNRDIPLLTLLNDYSLPYIVVDDKDINSKSMMQTITELKQKYIIYSGYGGGILKPHLFEMGKKFLHVHAGMVPEYRGSTTAYYSIIDNGNIGITAFFLAPGLDDGKVICQHEYELPGENIDIDYIYEPYLRAKELVCALNQYLENGVFSPIIQDESKAETYFIIHPVLKHIAIKKVLRSIKS